MKLWEQIEEAPDYFISECGLVKSNDRVLEYLDGRLRSVKGIIMKTQIDRGGYERVRLRVGKVSKSFRVHRLVAKAFIKNPDNKPQVNHKDGNKLHNHQRNLEWHTNSENQLHANSTGLRRSPSGRDSCRSERYVDVYKNGIFCKTLCGNIEMKSQGFDFRLVSACLKGKRKSHKGHTFKERRILND